MNYFENKSVVIIGATGVFGQLMAQKLAQQGADVRLIARSSQSLAALARPDRGEISAEAPRATRIILRPGT